MEMMLMEWTDVICLVSKPMCNKHYGQFQGDNFKVAQHHWDSEWCLHLLLFFSAPRYSRSLSLSLPCPKLCSKLEVIISYMVLCLRKKHAAREHSSQGH